MKLDFFTESDTQELIDYISLNHNPNKPLLFWIDLFCGCGGITEGFSKNENNFVVACVNHDEFAIKSHHENHPYCIHYTEDIRDWNVIHKIETLINVLRKEFNNCFVGLHASLECTHFSKAKGGLSRDADSRTLGYHLEKYLCIKPDFITIENVEEFLTWGPVDEEGKPIKELATIDYNLWKKMFTDNGYDYDYKILNAADFGAFTSRKRYFSIFAKEGLPIEFPKPTHAPRKKIIKGSSLLPYNAVREKLNLENEGISIFGLNKKGKPYVKATFERVYYGLLKFHNEGLFTIRYNGGDPSNKNKSVNEPLGTILTNNTHSVVKPVFISSYYGDSKDGKGIFKIDEPLRTITTKERFALHHLQYNYGNACYSNLEEPAGTITVTPKHQLVTTNWLYDTQFDRVGCSVFKPCPTIIARQDKKPLYLASATSVLPIPFLCQSVERTSDKDYHKKLRALMRELGISDIKIRSLEVDELLRIQGFPEDYVLKGGKVRSLKYIGNSVVPQLAEAFSNSIYKSLINK